MNNLPKNSIVLNNERVNQLPDVAKLTGMLIEFIEYIEEPSIKALALENEIVYKQHLENKFEEFTLEYYTIYRLLVDNENERASNVDKLFKMIDRLKKIESGESNYDNEFMQVREELAEEYLYSKYGSKTNFQKAMNKNRKNKK